MSSHYRFDLPPSLFESLEAREHYGLKLKENVVARILHLQSCMLPALHNCWVIIFYLIWKGEHVLFPLSQGTKAKNMYNSETGPVKAHNFHLIKGSE